MPRSHQQLRDDAQRIWLAGVEAVRPQRLLEAALAIEGRMLRIGGETFDLAKIDRIAVVGAGKAGAGMAEAVEEILAPVAAEKRLTGWVNVPADCVRRLPFLTLHAGRPAGVNEPMPEGAAGSREIVRIVESLSAADLCLCLISGGGSALMPAPVEGIALEDKLEITRRLSAAGANIEQLNTVRKQLSRIKGGGLARACRAGTLASLILSDVLGDPLDVIASGPTVPNTTTASDAVAVLEEFDLADDLRCARVAEYLRRKALAARDDARPACRVLNVVVGNNAKAVDAAGMEAERLGYSHAMISATKSEGPAEEVGRHLARMALRMRAKDGPDCLISGGEPVVRLVDAARRGLGGRNQQLVLAALARLAADGGRGILILSGGTDGEDGPTDAAGAFLDQETIARAKGLKLDPADYLARNDAYHFFAPLETLWKTGPTHTNVCDLRVVLVDRTIEAG